MNPFLRINKAFFKILDIGFEKAINFVKSSKAAANRSFLRDAERKRPPSEKGWSASSPLRLGQRKARENLSTPQELKLLFSVVEPRHKLSYLVSLLKKRRKSKSVVYFLTSDQVDYFHQVLRQLVNYPVIKCHGKKNQKLRSKAIKEFTDRSGGTVLGNSLQSYFL